MRRLWGDRSGREPLNARSDLRLRLVLNLVFVPVFAAGTALLWYWTTQAGPDTAPSDGSLRLLAVICAGLTLFALADLLIVVRRIKNRFPGNRRSGHADQSESLRPRR